MKNRMLFVLRCRKLKSFSGLLHPHECKKEDQERQGTKRENFYAWNNNPMP